MFLEYKEQFILFFENSENTLATLTAISATGSFIATYLSFKVANSSRKIAKNALNFQHKESISESINIIVSTLVTMKTNTVTLNNIQSNVEQYRLSLKRTDWIFAAQEIQNIIDDISALAKSEADRKKLMERFGRILDAKLRPINTAENIGIFTASKPNNTYLDIKFINKEKTIRDKDLFIVYMFTERYESYQEGSGQYPSPDRCCYFNKATNFELS